MHKVIMRGRLCALDVWRSAYLQSIVDYYKDPMVVDQMGAWQNQPFHPTVLETWVQNLLSSPRDLMFTVLVPNGNGEKREWRFVGMIGVKEIDWDNRVATYWILIADRSVWGTGVAREATLMLLKQMFSNLSFRVIYSDPVASNKRSLRFHRKMGFVECGRWPGRLLRRGKSVDEVHYVMRPAVWSKRWLRYKRPR